LLSLWSRVSAADFLTETEKRQAVGYGEYQVTGGIAKKNKKSDIRHGTARHGTA
jgi:hypothetical protein